MKPPKNFYNAVDRRKLDISDNLLPDVTTSDAGKVLKVSEAGAWQLANDENTIIEANPEGEPATTKLETLKIGDTVYYVDSGYQPENFITNVGSVSFNTGYIHKANTKIKTKIIAPGTSFTEYGCLFGSRKDTYVANAFGLFTRFQSPKFCAFRTGSEKQTDDWTAQTNSTPFYNVPVVIEAEGNNFSWYRIDDPSTVHSVTSEGTVDDGFNSMGIFCGNKSTNANDFVPFDYDCITMYWFEIYEGTTLIHRYVPAYNNNQYCLYDEVTENYLYDTFNNGHNVRGFITT